MYILIIINWALLEIYEHYIIPSQTESFPTRLHYIYIYIYIYVYIFPICIYPTFIYIYIYIYIYIWSASMFIGWKRHSYGRWQNGDFFKGIVFLLGHKSFPSVFQCFLPIGQKYHWQKLQCHHRMFSTNNHFCIPPYIFIFQYNYSNEHTFSSYVRIRDVVLKTCLVRWTIGRSGERGSGISVLPARHDDDDNNCFMFFIHVVKTAALILTFSLPYHDSAFTYGCRVGASCPLMQSDLYYNTTKLCAIDI